MKNESKYNQKEKILIYALSIGVGVFTSLVSVIIFAIAMLMLDLGESSSALFAVISIAVGGFVSAFLSSKKLNKGGILNGTICAVATFLVVFFISLIVDKGGVTFNTLFNLVTAFLSGLIGGISGIGQKKYNRF